MDWARCGDGGVGRPSCFTRACSKHVRYVYTFGCICCEILPSFLPQPLHTSSLAVWRFIHYRERLLSPTRVQQPVQENWTKWVGRGEGGDWWRKCRLEEYKSRKRSNSQCGNEIISKYLNSCPKYIVDIIMNYSRMMVITTVYLLLI